MSFCKVGFQQPHSSFQGQTYEAGSSVPDALEWIRVFGSSDVIASQPAAADFRQAGVLR
jgi:hypothetical protein